MRHFYFMTRLCSTRPLFCVSICRRCGEFLLVFDFYHLSQVSRLDTERWLENQTCHRRVASFSVLPALLFHQPFQCLHKQSLSHPFCSCVCVALRMSWRFDMAKLFLSPPLTEDYLHGGKTKLSKPKMSRALRETRLYAAKRLFGGVIQTASRCRSAF